MASAAISGDGKEAWRLWLDVGLIAVALLRVHGYRVSFYLPTGRS
jgi:hypothetical protein